MTDEGWHPELPPAPLPDAATGAPPPATQPTTRARGPIRLVAILAALAVVAIAGWFALRPDDHPAKARPRAATTVAEIGPGVVLSATDAGPGWLEISPAVAPGSGSTGTATAQASGSLLLACLGAPAEDQTFPGTYRGPLLEAKGARVQTTVGRASPQDRAIFVRRGDPGFARCLAQSLPPETASALRGGEAVDVGLPEVGCYRFTSGKTPLVVCVGIVGEATISMIAGGSAFADAAELTRLTTVPVQRLRALAPHF
jgi:hypothetical protein